MTPASIAAAKAAQLTERAAVIASAPTLVIAGDGTAYDNGRTKFYRWCVECEAHCEPVRQVNETRQGGYGEVYIYRCGDCGTMFAAIMPEPWED